MSYTRAQLAAQRRQWEQAWPLDIAEYLETLRPKKEHRINPAHFWFAGESPAGHPVCLCSRRSRSSS